MLKILEEMCKETVIDEDKNVLLLLVLSFKRLSTSKKIEIKMQFLRILHDAENQDLRTTELYSRPTQTICYSADSVYVHHRYNQMDIISQPPLSPGMYSIISKVTSPANHCDFRRFNISTILFCNQQRTQQFRFFNKSITSDTAGRIPG